MLSAVILLTLGKVFGNALCSFSCSEGGTSYFSKSSRPQLSTIQPVKNVSNDRDYNGV